MKILFLYTYNKGLLSRFYQELSTRLSSEKYQVLNFHLKHTENRFVINGVEYSSQKRSTKFNNYIHIFKIIRKTKPDVIISNFSYVNPAILFGRLLGVQKNIVWFHTVYLHARPNRIKVFIKSLFLSAADKVISNSAVLAEDLATVYRVKRNKIYKIPFWTDISQIEPSDAQFKYSPCEKPFRVGVPGRLLFNKNFQTVLRAMDFYRSDYDTQFHLHIAGYGEYEKNLRDLVTELDLSSYVDFEGNLEVEEMVAFFRSMDLIVLPSFNEAFGLVFIEAISMGVPVIVSKSFGALDFIEFGRSRITEFTFDPSDPVELSEKIKVFRESKGPDSLFFKELYLKNFDKQKIYEKFKSVIFA